MTKRVGMIAGILMWVTLAVSFTSLMGPDGALAFVIGLCLLALAIKGISHRRAKRLAQKIERASGNSVRFNGPSVHEQKVMQIALENGWVAERLSQSGSANLSVRFEPGENARSVQEFLQSLNKAGLIKSMNR